MRWQGRRQSRNVEDRRGAGLGGGFGGFGRGGPGIRIPIGRKGGLGGIAVIALFVLYMLAGGDLGMQEGEAPPSGVAGSASDELGQFVAVVLADTEEAWHTVFRERGGTYQEPTLVLFSGQVGSACGYAQAAVGPFYCPADRKIYIDLAFYRDLRQRLGAPGDFAQAYVIAHEVGHHVQTLQGLSSRVRAAQAAASRSEANAIQVRMELQADCYAGLWAHYAERYQGVLEPGDIQEALGAAEAIGDDRLQRQAQGYVVPDAFTHGTSEQRARWFTRGYQEGRMEACDTFRADRP
jgi:predicted metalloprotease